MEHAFFSGVQQCHDRPGERHNSIYTPIRKLGQSFDDKKPISRDFSVAPKKKDRAMQDLKILQTIVEEKYDCEMCRDNFIDNTRLNLYCIAATLLQGIMHSNQIC